MYKLPNEEEIRQKQVIIGFQRKRETFTLYEKYLLIRIVASHIVWGICSFFLKRITETLYIIKTTFYTN